MTPDARVLEARRAHRRRVVDVAQVDHDRPRAAAPSRARDRASGTGSTRSRSRARRRRGRPRRRRSHSVSSGSSLRAASIACGIVGLHARAARSAARARSRARATSRMSSVSGLNESPSTPIVLPAHVAVEQRRDLLDHALAAGARSPRSRRRRSASGSPRSRANARSSACPSGSTSRRSPGPACRNFEPIRRSRPMPRAMSWTSAPTCSHRFANSLMNEIFVARNAFAAYLVSSAVDDVGDHDGRLDQVERAVQALAGSRWRASSSVPITTRSGRMKSPIAAPSRRNSGFEATLNSTSRPPRASSSSIQRAHALGGAHRHRALVDDHLVAVERAADLARDRLDGAQVGAAVRQRRRRHRDEDHERARAPRRRCWS